LYRKKPFPSFLFVLATIFVAGCASIWQPIPPSKLGEDIEDHPAVILEDTGIDARSNASNELLLRARAMLDNNKPDDAIDLLEQAISLDPKDGRNYYYLAAGWMMKGNAPQALECNNLAGVYLGYDQEWVQKIKEQRDDIDQIE